MKPCAEQARRHNPLQYRIASGNLGDGADAQDALQESCLQVATTSSQRSTASRNARPPKCLFVDNGSEFSGQLLDLWAYHQHSKIGFSRPGKPSDNRFIETFNGSLRDECLNVHLFASLAEARAVVDAWRRDCNESRPRMALWNPAPAAFARETGPEQA